ncbi:MAG: sugar phosphate isomerase/epimerase [Lachnospiraceae bacterium]|nr:sugar phosphate isomerase/epimerase [Lachnospiraceae bacterium]
MQLGIRLHDTEEGTFEDRIARVHELGFRCGHLALSKMKGLPASPEALTPGYAMYLRRIFEKNEVDIAVLGCYLNLAHPDPEKLREITDRYLAHIRFAGLCGAGVVGTETGAPNAGYKPCPECRTEEALRTFITNLRPVVSCAEKAGVIFAIEPVAKHIVYDAKRARRVLDEIGSPNLQIIFDPVNLLDEENYERRDEIFAETMDLLGPDIAMVHLKDFRPEKKKDPVTGEERLQLTSVGCGLGEMDYGRILRFVKEHKPFVHATLENTTPADCEACRDKILREYEAV